MAAPLEKTRAAASGSTWKLNSAAAVMLPPSKTEPPMSTMPSRWLANRGSRAMASATVGQGRQAAKGNRFGRARHDQFDDHIGCKPGLERRCGFGQFIAIEACPPVDVLGGYQGPHQRSGGPGEDGDVSPVGQLQCFAGVLRCELDGNVPGYRGDGQHLQFIGRGNGGQERQQRHPAMGRCRR